jgi:arginase
MSLPDPLRKILNQLINKESRGRIPLSQLSEEFNISETETLQIATLLTAKGFLFSFQEQTTGQLFYGIRFGQKRGRDLPLDLRNALQSLKAIQLIEVKSDIGAGKRGANLGLEAIKTASFQFKRKFFSHYPTRQIKSEQYLPKSRQRTPFARGIENIFALYQEVSEVVKETLLSGALPIVISGDHSTAGGTIAGIKMAYPHARLGVIWIDAHADIHSPYTTPSGNMHGMPLATALGEDNLDCQVNHPQQKTIDLWNQIKNLGGIYPKIDYQDLVYVAVRETEP